MSRNYVLKKFEREDASAIEGKDLYLICYFPSYIEELYSRYHYTGKICGVFDVEKSKHGKKEVCYQQFEVIDTKGIESLSKESVLMITTGYFEEQFEEIKRLKLPLCVDNTIYFLANQDTEYYLRYHKKFRTERLRNIIVFRSSTGTWEYVPGMDYTDNARALFEYMLRVGLNYKYKLVWLVKNPSDYQDIAGRYNNVEFLSFEWAVSETEDIRQKYYETICLARYFFFTQASGFCRLRREGQVRIQLWHGCGPKAEKFPIRQEKHYEYMPVTSKFYAESCIQVFGLNISQILVVGLPKEDWILHPIRDWKEKFGVPKGKKYVFWLPTFRNTFDALCRFNTNINDGINGLPLFKSLDDIKEMDLYLREMDVVLVIKLHPLQKEENDFNSDFFTNVIFIKNYEMSRRMVHINELLGEADALISDYSSVVVDYLILDRPIGIVLSDLQEFKKNRGVCIDSQDDWLPGYEIYTLDDMKLFIKDISDDRDRSSRRRGRVRELSLTFTDDKSCERLVTKLGI